MITKKFAKSKKNRNREACILSSCSIELLFNKTEAIMNNDEHEICCDEKKHVKSLYFFSTEMKVCDSWHSNIQFDR